MSHGVGLRIGDHVSLFSANHFGFMSADGFADDSIRVYTMNPNDLCPPEFENCVFQLQVKLTYFAQERVRLHLAAPPIVSVAQHHTSTPLSPHFNPSRLLAPIPLLLSFDASPCHRLPFSHSATVRPVHEGTEAQNRRGLDVS